MNKRNWKRIGRTLATALLAGSLTVGAVSAVAPAVSPQPVIAAALTTTNYPYEDVNYGDNRASIYIDTTGFTATQLSAVNQGIANVQSMLAGIFTISVTNDKNQADMIISGHDFGAPSTTSGSRGGDTTITAVVNHIIQHPSRSSILLNNYYRSYATSVFFSPTYSPQLPATTDPNYQYYFDHYQAAYDKLNNDELILTTEHEIGHAIGLAHTDRDTYGVAIMNPIEAVDANGNVLASFTRDPTYIRAAQAIYGGQAIVLGETDVKQPTQGYHGSTAGSSGNSGNTGNGGNTGNTGNSGNNGNSGNTGNNGNGNTGNSGNTNNAGNSGNDTSSQKNTVKPASGTVNVYQASGAEVYSDADFTNDTGRKLPQNSQWKGFGIVLDAAGNTVGFNVGGQQYVKFSESSFVSPLGHTNESQTVSGVFKINVPGHPTWGTAFYNDALQVKGILRGGSRWRVFARKTLGDGKQYYNLGGNQWIRSDYGSFIQ